MTPRHKVCKIKIESDIRRDTVYYFHNDYNEICHSRVLERMMALQGVPMEGYGMDTCCEKAADRIRKLCGDDNLCVHFIPGGTQANVTVIAAALRPYQAVIAPESAHIHCHETGALEGTGHKILALPSPDGKITPEQIRSVCAGHFADRSHEHIAQPKMVYISVPTELGTMYTLSELEEISGVCRDCGLYLFADGARLGYGLASRGNRITLEDMARLTDVFYIGGTKQGTMLGEAVVISDPAIAKDFRYMIKHQCGMMAKGWIMGAQFDAILEDGLYFSLARRANELAEQIRGVLTELGCDFLVQSHTNQIFPILPDRLLDQLQKNFSFSEQIRVDEKRRAVRFCTSWASTDESVKALCSALKELSQ